MPSKKVTFAPGTKGPKPKPQKYESYNNYTDQRPRIAIYQPPAGSLALTILRIQKEVNSNHKQNQRPQYKKTSKGWVRNEKG